MINRIVTAAVVFVLFPIHAAGSLVYKESDGLFLYYSADEDRIANRLLEKFPAMRNFLENQGLPLKFPLHVIVDNKLDRPAPEVKTIPHREIRIPLRAPGVLEDGYLQTDPWSYFFFHGLCLQAIYSERSGIHGATEKVFGQLMSPNKILPEWIKTGVCHLLHRIFTGDRRRDPPQPARLPRCRRRPEPSGMPSCASRSMSTGGTGLRRAHP